MSNHDLDWVAAQQPQRRGTDKEAHDRALLSLLRHAAARPRGRRRGAGLSGLLNRRILTVATAAGLAAITAAVVLSVGGSVKPAASPGHPHTGALRAVVSHHRAKSPLIRLADQVSASTATPGGDATLIQRTTTIAGQQPVTVYDLYGDNGTYYFSTDESGMPAQVSGGENQGGGLFGREVAAAEQAASGNVAQAAIDLANAPDPNRANLITPTSQTPEETAAAKIKAKLTHTVPGPGSLFDNWAWEDAQDAMIAGAGNPQVRAGVLQILATLPGVTVTHGTSADGQPTLVLTAGADEVGSGYQEQLTVNAETGMPIQFVGGAPNGSAATTVSYAVQRVTLADIAAGTAPSFRG